MNKKCQIFTPDNYVDELLDNVGYTENLYGKKILENSCGTGNVLVAIVRRYISDCRKKGFSDLKIQKGLENDIYGVEIDNEQYSFCIERLNNILLNEKLNLIKCNITNRDYLKKNEVNKYDYIVGNPPYVTYTEIKDEDKNFLRETFESCKKGKFDYCYAFIEKSLQSLSSNGKLAYLIPSSIFKTVFGSNLREIMKPYIEKIYDYTQEKMFDDVLIKSAIMILNKKREKEYFYYKDVTLNKQQRININELKDKWVFVENTMYGSRRFGDYFKVSHVVATLLNEAYVLKDYVETEDFIECQGYRLESDIIKNTATPKTQRYHRKEKIIFPYYYDDKNELKRYTDEEFLLFYPEVAAYLNRFRDKLDRRKKDANSRWFEYGRSQALRNLNNSKLLISTVITSKVLVYKLDKECIPYSGLYITIREDNKELSIEDAETVLKSEGFMQYVLHAGIHINGTSVRITSRDIEEYRF